MDIKHEMKNMSHCWFWESDVQFKSSRTPKS